MTATLPQSSVRRRLTPQPVLAIYDALDQLTVFFSAKLSSGDQGMFHLMRAGVGVVEFSGSVTVSTESTTVSGDEGDVTFPPYHTGSVTDGVVLGTPATFTVVAATDVFTVTGHGFTTGCFPVTVSNSGGALPAGLSALLTYWPIRLTDNTFRLALTKRDAILGIVVDVTGAGTGTHSIRRAAVYTGDDDYCVYVSGTLRGRERFLVHPGSRCPAMSA